MVYNNNVTPGIVVVKVANDVTVVVIGVLVCSQVEYWNASGVHSETKKD